MVTQLVATITQTKFDSCITSFLPTNQWKLPTWWPARKTLWMTADYTYQPYYCNGMQNQAMQQCFQFLQEKFALKRWKGGIKRQYVLFFIFSSSQNCKPRRKNFSLPWGSKGGGAMPLWGPSQRRGKWPAVFGQGDMFWATPWEKQRKERNGEEWLSRHVVPQRSTRLWDR